MATPVGKNAVNIYGAAIVGAAALKVHIFKGEEVFNKSTGKYVNAPALGAGGLTAAHALTTTSIPHADNEIGFMITIPTTLPLGVHDLVVLDNLTYIQGIRMHIAADRQVTIIPE